MELETLREKNRKCQAGNTIVGCAKMTSTLVARSPSTYAAKKEIRAVGMAQTQEYGLWYDPLADFKQPVSDGVAGSLLKTGGGRIA